MMKHEINANIVNSRKCSLYRYLIYGFNIQYCLRKSLPMKYQKIIAKIRLSPHILSIIETGRYSTATQVKQVGVVFHVLTVLTMSITSYQFVLFRTEYIKDYYYKRPSMFKLVQLFIFNSMKRRSSDTITRQYILCVTCIYVRICSPENAPLS